MKKNGCLIKRKVIVMMLLTKELKNKLMTAKPSNMRPIVKFFDPCGAATWLVCYMEPDEDVCWAYCDLGMQCVEFGTVSFKELSTIRNRMGLPMERDLYFKDDPTVNYLEKDSLCGI
jgi:hypothetical protein